MNKYKKKLTSENLQTIRILLSSLATENGNIMGKILIPAQVGRSEKSRDENEPDQRDHWLWKPKLPEFQEEKTGTSREGLT